MPALATAGALFSIGSSLLSAFGSFGAARAARRAARKDANDVLGLGEEDVASMRRSLSALIGRQRVGGAAQGIDLEHGTAALIDRQTREIGAMDVATIRRNAQRQAFSILRSGSINARQMRNRGFQDAFSGAGTLLGLAADPWDRYQGRQRAAQSVTDFATSTPDAMGWL